MEETTEGQRLFRDVVDAAGALADMADATVTPNAPQEFVVMREEVRKMVDKMLVVGNQNGDDPVLVGAVTVMELVIKTIDAATQNPELTAAKLWRMVEINVATAVQRIDELTRV